MVPIEEQDKKFFVQVGNNIASARKTLGLTQTQLAQKMAVTQQLIASYETGRRRIPLSFLVRIADALYLQLDDLIPVDRPKRRGPIPRIQRALDVLPRLPKQKQKLVLDLIDTVVESDSKET